MDRVKGSWKVIGIIFIILFVLETLFVIWAWNVGGTMIEQENECSINLCAGEEYDAYYYDSAERMCYCFVDGEVALQQYIT